MVRFLGYKNTDEVKVPDAATLERQRFNNMTRRFNIMPNTTVAKTWAPEKYRSLFKIPSPYYLGRDYKSTTLSRYDIGDSDRSNRTVVPVYDIDHRVIVGMTARTHWDQCSKCQYYHSPDEPCPTRIVDQINACKWKNSPGFEAAHYLYNLWFAREHIMETSTIILVEGPGDVWRLEEADIKNSVAIFGTDLTEEQLTLIESSWAMNAIVLTDSDEAGREAAQNIKEKLQRTHRLYFPMLEANDVGDLQTDQVTDDIMPILTQIATFHKRLQIKACSSGYQSA
jgi:5S rRNA maturation endonuclease (ribonuclease M5)